MSDVRIAVPRSIDQAGRLAERFATLEGEIGLAEAARAEAIARANAVADAAIGPLVTEREAIRDRISVWWAKAGSQVLIDQVGGKRKTIELGGCLIGSKAGRVSLSVDGSEDDVVAVLRKRDWAADLLRTRVTLDKAAIVKALDGSYGKQLGKLGLGKAGGEEQFVLERAGQAATPGAPK